MKSRLLLLALLAGGIGTLVFVLSEDPPAPTGIAAESGDVARTTPFLSAAECQACHQEVYAEWETSYHAMAWTDPMVQALSDGFRQPECIDCHAPQPIHVTGVDMRVAPRNHDRERGVDCISCHILDDGVSVAASGDIDTTSVSGACRPVARPVMATSTACAGCHNQHETVDELLAADIGKECQSCHMEPVTRGTGDAQRPGRSHAFPGCHDEEMLRSSVSLEVRVEDGVVLADVTNVGGGHHVPTDARHRSYNLWVSAWDDAGNVIVDRLPMEAGEFRLYYRDDFKESTQIAHGQTRTGTWAIPAGFAGKVRVDLSYALNPEELGLGIVTELHNGEVMVP